MTSPTTSTTEANLATVEPRGARYEHPDESGIGRVIIDRPEDSVNALDPALVEALRLAFLEARADEALAGLLLVSGKPAQFVAGADLILIASDPPPGADDVSAISRRFQAVCDLLAWMPCTTVAVINGPALGGGFELALACDYRVAADNKAVSVGQPEVNLGLVPAGGGTQRLPRLVGLPAALDAILAGRRYNARRAKRAGLLDDVVHPAVLQQAGRAWAKKPKRPLNRPLHVGPNVQSAMDLAELTPAGRSLFYRQARESVQARTHGHYPAPFRAIDAVQAGLEHGMAAGLEAEARAFGELAVTPTARNLVWLFLATQHQKRLSGVDDPAVKPLDVSHLGVVGAGFMGSGIAEVGAVAGYTVRVRDTKPEAVAKGLATARGFVSEGTRRRTFDRYEAADITHRLSGATDYSGFASADLVIEAVFEDLGVKQRVVAELEQVVRPETVIASNTSALPIHQIAARAEHPERIVGMHFFSPAHRMPLLEVVRGQQSADSAVATAVAAGNAMGKTVIVVGDGPGFYTSRILGVLMNEAAVLLAEGACMQAVDKAMTSFGFPVGPFVLYDEVGLEVAQHVGETLSRAFGADYPTATVVSQLVARGRTGRRAGAGFYAWPKPQPPIKLPLPVQLPTHLPLLPQPPGHVDDGVVRELLGRPAPRVLTPHEIQERLALLLVSEAVRCLDEGVLRSPTDGDLGAVLGIGFPPFLGGPFHYADTLGLSSLRATLDRLAAAHGHRYTPSALLARKGERGESFYA